MIGSLDKGALQCRQPGPPEPVGALSRQRLSEVVFLSWEDLVDLGAGSVTVSFVVGTLVALQRVSGDPSSVNGDIGSLRGDGHLDGAMDREAEVVWHPQCGHSGEQVWVHEEEVYASALDGPGGRRLPSVTIVPGQPARASRRRQSQPILTWPGPARPD